MQPKSNEFKAKSCKSDFLILNRRIHGRPLVYLDNASTTQKPKVVLDKLEQYYTRTNANIHRGVHTLSEEATKAYESARKTVANFINADPNEIVFTRNATEAINLVARTWGVQNLKRGDTIVVTEMEHHSNLLPWKWLTEQKGAHLAVIPVTDDGQLNLHVRLPTSDFRLLAVTQMSNVLGTINPIAKLSKWAHAHGALLLVDGAQSVAHMPIDVNKLGCDFFVFSGHKIGGPTGIGVLWARKELLEKMEPFLYGGDMVKSVRIKNAVRHPELVEGSRTISNKLLITNYQLLARWNDTPYKFEAGTPNIAGAIGLGAAVAYLQKIGMKNVERYVQSLTQYALQKLGDIPEVNMLLNRHPEPRPLRRSFSEASRGISPRDLAHGGVISFTVTGIHPHDLATILDRDGIAIRSGHHCAMPLHERFGLAATARASFWIYNTKEDVNALVRGIKKAQRVFVRKLTS